MTIFQRLEAIEPALTQVQADVAALKAAPVGGVTADQLAAVESQLNSLAVLIGTPAA